MSKAVKILDEKRLYDGGYILSVVVWGIPDPVPPSEHDYKYSLFFGRHGERLVAYDNERGKGDHKHLTGTELPYRFTSLRRLLADFLEDVRRVAPEVTL